MSFFNIRSFRSLLSHDDVIKWKPFPRYWPFVRGIHRWPVNSPHNGQWRGALMFSLICAWKKVWVNNREAGDSRRHRADYDVIVMSKILPVLNFDNKKLFAGSNLTNSGVLFHNIIHESCWLRGRHQNHLLPQTFHSPSCLGLSRRKTYIKTHRFVMVPTLSSMTLPEIVLWTSCATSDNKVGTMIAVGFRFYRQQKSLGD